MVQSIYSVPCECGRRQFGKTGRPLALQLCEHKLNLKENRRVGLDEARILEIKSNSRYRKYKKLAHMAYLTSLISQPNLDISPISTVRLPAHRDQYDVMDSSWVYVRFLLHRWC
jgi:hypothetical protein